MMTDFPTPYPDVNLVLDRLLAGARDALGERFVGLYLHGSLAYGDFNPATSDIDFLVVTDPGLAEGTFTALQEMHARLFTCGLPWSQKIEGGYLPRDVLRRHHPDHPAIPWLSLNGQLERQAIGVDWIIQRWILREKGVTLAGPPIQPMIDPVSPDNLREAVRCDLRNWWSPPFPRPTRFETSGYRAYAVLTMCRSLYVLANGRIASKPEAARWALETLDPPWADLVARAASWRPGGEFSDQQETFSFIQFTGTRSLEGTGSFKT